MGDFLARLGAAVPAVIFAVAIVAMGAEVFAAGILLLGLVCLHEVFGMFSHARPVRLAGFLGLAALVGAALWGDQFHVLLVQVALVPVLFGLVLASPVRRGATASMSLTLFAVWWIGLALAHAVLLREMPHGGAILVDVLVGTFIGDTGAYFGGRMYGRRLLAPRISPNKTVEGLLIGMVFAVAATWFAGLYQDWLSGTDALLIGLAVALTAPLGDLFESTIKRDAGTKDTGRLFGAHGGALDRLDAVFFTVPAAFYVWTALL
ncbi:MAG TPA: phosphatidate cytidylyltransferase [Solirubrobacteraceae bacterium]|nr:phosphatidate cytidylyltransferase [Solirubrobacteraceae bacterium]